MGTCIHILFYFYCLRFESITDHLLYFRSEFYENKAVGVVLSSFIHDYLVYMYTYVRVSKTVKRALVADVTENFTYKTRHLHTLAVIVCFCVSGQCASDLRQVRHWT